MAKTGGQKLKLLYLAKMLTEETDETHGVTLQQMLEMLAAHGINAERKSVYDDIEALRTYGYDIERRKDKNWNYYIANRTFQMPELKLLVDAVQSSRFITRKKSDELIKKLESLASRHQAGALQRQVYVAGRIKTMNESIYYNIDAVHAAISAGCQLSFRYFEWTPKKQKHFRHDGARYRVSPFTLVWNDEYYYLVAYDHSSQMLRNYRVDKMQELRAEPEKREGMALFEKQDPALYTKRIFDMYGGEEETLTLRFVDRLAGAVLDRFGNEVHLADQGDGSFWVTVHVVASPRFYGWLFGFGKDAQIVAPTAAVAAFHRFANETMQQYQEVAHEH